MYLDKQALTSLAARLDRGEYNGVDIMEAVSAIKELIKAREELDIVVDYIKRIG